MKWFGRLLGLIVALSGFAAAHVLVQTGSAQIPPVPTVSVTVPTVSVPDAAGSFHADANGAGTFNADADRADTGAFRRPVPPCRRRPTTAPPVRLPPAVTSPPVTPPAPTPRRRAADDHDDRSTALRSPPPRPGHVALVGPRNGDDRRRGRGTARPRPPADRVTAPARTRADARRPGEDEDARGEKRTGRRRRVSVRLGFVLPEGGPLVPRRPWPGAVLPRSPDTSPSVDGRA